VITISVPESSLSLTGHTKTLYKMLSCLAEDDHSDYVMDWDHQGSVRIFVGNIERVMLYRMTGVVLSNMTILL